MPREPPTTPHLAFGIGSLFCRLCLDSVRRRGDRGDLAGSLLGRAPPLARGDAGKRGLVGTPLLRPGRLIILLLTTTPSAAAEVHHAVLRVANAKLSVCAPGFAERRVGRAARVAARLVRALDGDHSAPRVVGAELRRPGARHSVGSGLAAAGVAAQLGVHVDGPLRSVLGAELPRSRGREAERGVLGAAGVAAHVAVEPEADHSVLRVLRAVLLGPAALPPEGRVSGTVWMAAPLLADIEHARQHRVRVLDTELRLLGALYPVGRPLGATFVGARLPADVDHPLLRVPGAELPLLSTCHPKPRQGVATWVPTSLAGDVDHSVPRVFSTELRRPCALDSVRRDLVAAGVPASLAPDIDHSILRVLGAKLRLLRPRYAVGRLLRTARAGAPLVADIHHSVLRVPGAILRLPRTFDAVRRPLLAIAVGALVNHPVSCLPSPCRLRTARQRTGRSTATAFGLEIAMACRVPARMPRGILGKEGHRTIYCCDQHTCDQLRVRQNFAQHKAAPRNPGRVPKKSAGKTLNWISNLLTPLSSPHPSESKTHRIATSLTVSVGRQQRTAVPLPLRPLLRSRRVLAQACRVESEQPLRLCALFHLQPACWWR